MQLLLNGADTVQAVTLQCTFATALCQGVASMKCLEGGAWGVEEGGGRANLSHLTFLMYS